VNVNSYLNEIMADRTLVYVCWGVAFLLGIVTCSIIGSIRDRILDRRYERREYEAAMDATRIQSGWRDDLDATVDNEAYFEATTDGKGYRLNDKWREIVNSTQPRSPEVVAARSYQSTVSRQEAVRIIKGTRPQWPTWADDERTVPGRHRKDGTALAALRTPTQEWSVVDQKELTRV
jgi:hypothetical protein